MRNLGPLHRCFYLPEKFCCPYFRMTHAPESSCFKKLFRPEAQIFSCSLVLSLCPPLPTFQSFGFVFVEDEGVSSSVFLVPLQHVVLVRWAVNRERRIQRRNAFIISPDREHTWHEWRADMSYSNQTANWWDDAFLHNKPINYSPDGQQFALKGRKEGADDHIPFDRCSLSSLWSWSESRENCSLGMLSGRMGKSCFDS